MGVTRCLKEWGTGSFTSQSKMQAAPDTSGKQCCACSSGRAELVKTLRFRCWKSSLPVPVPPRWIQGGNTGDWWKKLFIGAGSWWWSQDWVPDLLWFWEPHPNPVPSSVEGALHLEFWIFGLNRASQLRHRWDPKAATRISWGVWLSQQPQQALCRVWGQAEGSTADEEFRGVQVQISRGWEMIPVGPAGIAGSAHPIIHHQLLQSSTPWIWNAEGKNEQEEGGAEPFLWAWKLFFKCLCWQLAWHKINTGLFASKQELA